MSSLKELRSRIKGVQSTQKITNAMRMVAAAKLKKSQSIVKNLQHFSDGFHDLAHQVLMQYEGEEINSPLLPKTKHDRHLLIVITSDRGLCGGFNAMILKSAQKPLSRYAKKNTEVLAIGKRANDYFLKNHKFKLIELASPTTFSRIPELSQVRSIADEIIELIATKNLNEITVVSSHLQSVLIQTPLISKIFPFECNTMKKNTCDFICEPEIKKLIPGMIYNNFVLRLLSIFVENIASEHAARMTAMENASRNAREMIDELKLMLNRSRQAKITTELMEIISGAEALVSY